MNLLLEKLVLSQTKFWDEHEVDRWKCIVKIVFNITFKIKQKLTGDSARRIRSCRLQTTPTQEGEESDIRISNDVPLQIQGLRKYLLVIIHHFNLANNLFVKSIFFKCEVFSCIFLRSCNRKDKFMMICCAINETFQNKIMST